ncbi:rhomboid family intramembrane serine protease [Bacteroidota bacterium]
MYIGRFGSIPPVVKNLLIINVLLLLATGVARTVMGVDLTRAFGLHYVESNYFRPYQIVTHMFMHANFWHLFFNMFALWMFGKVLEGVWGSKRFLIYYFVTGLGAAALHTFVQWIEFSSIQKDLMAFMNTPSVEGFVLFIKDHFPQYENFLKSNGTYNNLVDAWASNPDNSHYANQSVEYLNAIFNRVKDIPTVGASGAVYGVLLGFGVLFPNTQIMLLFPPIPIRAKYFVIIYGALELYLGLTQPGSNIAHFAHLGGMLFGFLLIKYWNKNTRNFY